MGFSEAVRTCFIDKYAIFFSGRASRSEFWWFQLLWLPVAIVSLLAVGLGVALEGLIGSVMSGGAPSFLLLALIGIVMSALWIGSMSLILPMLSVTVRRLHDRNMSGWWYLAFAFLFMIPIVNLIAIIGFIVLMALKGTDGPNRFGPDPLRPESGAQVFS